MKLLAYFARIHLGVFLLVQLGLVVVVVSATLIESAGQLSRANVSGDTTLLLAIYNGVIYGYQLFPVACFLSVLLAGTLLARSGELLAAEAAGISAWCTGLAFGAVVGILSLLAAVAGEFVVPRAVGRLDRLQSTELSRGNDPLKRFYQQRVQWYRDGDLLLHLPQVDARARTFGSLAAYRLKDGLIAEIIDADALEHDGQAFWLVGARVYNLRSGATQLSPRLSVPLTVTPEQLVDVTGDPRLMSASQVRGLIGRRARAGFDVAAYEIELTSRKAFPLAALCMFLLVLPWSLDPSRRRALAVNLGVGVLVVGILLSLMQVFRLLALAQRVPPWLGSWAINLICLLVLPASLWLYRRVRTRGAIF